MKCASIQLKDRRELTYGRKVVETKLDYEEVHFSPSVHSYTFRYDKPRTRHEQNPYVTEVNLDLPKNIKSFNTGSSLNKWNNKTSRLKTGQRNRVCSPKTTSRSIVTEDYEDSSLLDIIKNEYFNSKLGDSHEAETGAEAGAELYVDDLVNNNVENNQEIHNTSSESPFKKRVSLPLENDKWENTDSPTFNTKNYLTPIHIPKLHTSFADEDCDLDPEIKKFLSITQAAISNETGQKRCIRNRIKKSSKRPKSKEETSDVTNSKNRTKKIIKTVSVSLTKPPSPHTVQVIRVDVTASISMEEECFIETERSQRNVVEVEKEDLVKEAENKNSDIDLQCKKLVLRIRTT